MHPDELYLTRAIELARFGSRQGDGGPFGAVIVHDGQIVGESWNRVIATVDPTAHAEIGAIRAACQHLGRHHLDGCTLYASSEPCPMCLSAAYWARLDRIVFANRRCEAAAIGFCDDELYAELKRDIGERRLLMEHQPLAAAQTLMRDWAADPRHQLY
jgi:tRNA(Arg) A34 adenosine deaminase TadA